MKNNKTNSLEKRIEFLERVVVNLGDCNNINVNAQKQLHEIVDRLDREVKSIRLALSSIKLNIVPNEGFRIDPVSPHHIEPSLYVPKVSDDSSVFSISEIHRRHPYALWEVRKGDLEKREFMVVYSSTNSPVSMPLFKTRIEAQNWIHDHSGNNYNIKSKE